MKAKKGMRVDVFSPDQKTHYGVGTITRVCRIKILGRVIKSYPAEIKLDNGKTTEGIDCWWYPITLAP